MKIQQLKLQIIFSLFLFIFFSGCVSLTQSKLSPEAESALYPVESYVPASFEWKEVVPGIMRFDFCNSDFPLIYHVVKIDLDVSEDKGLYLESARGVRTSEFAEHGNLTVAVNATPFSKSGSLVGIHKENGIVVSEPVLQYAAIGFRGEVEETFEKSENGENNEFVGDIFSSNCVNFAHIFYTQSASEFEGYPFVFGGFFTVLEHGEVRQDFVRRCDSRSGAGLSADGKTLYILVVEGERKSQSRGLSYPQCGEIFKALGCSDALEFDGGGSAELCIEGKSVLSYKVHRIQGNCFGFKY